MDDTLLLAKVQSAGDRMQALSLRVAHRLGPIILQGREVSTADKALMHVCGHVLDSMCKARELLQSGTATDSDRALINTYLEALAPVIADTLPSMDAQQMGKN